MEKAFETIHGRV